jgi:hypothetical protein
MLGVAASETSAAQTDDAQWPAGLCVVGVGRPAWGRGSSPGRVTNRSATRTPLEGATAGGESPVGDAWGAGVRVEREYHPTRGIGWETGSTTAQG